MDDIYLSELLKELKDLAEENQTRKILEILNSCETLDDAKDNIKALLINNTTLPKAGLEV